MVERTDVLVIGGGLLGTAIAWSVVSTGADTVVLEKDQVNRHASGQNAGSLHFQLEYRMIANGLKEAQRAAEAMPLHLDAAQEWATLSDSIGEDLHVSQDGGLMLAESSAQALKLEEKIELERSWGLGVELVTGSELHRRFPYLAPDVVAASFCPVEGKANSRLVAPALARAAARRGASIRTRTTVTSIARQGNRWRVGYQSDTSETVHIEADAVVLAGGIWTEHLLAMLGVSLPVYPVALTMVATARARRALPQLIQHVAARLSLKQTGEGNFLIGGGWPATFRSTAAGSPRLDVAPSLVASSVQRSVLVAQRVLPELRSAAVLRMWTGATTLTPDQLPLLGAVPGRSGVFVATGGSAFTLGPTFARLLALLIMGVKPDLDITPYDPRRFES